MGSPQTGTPLTVKFIHVNGDGISVNPAPHASELVSEVRARIAEVLDVHKGRLVLLLGGSELHDDREIGAAFADLSEATITVVKMPCLVRPSDYSSYVVESGVEKADGSLGYGGGHTETQGYVSLREVKFPEPMGIDINMMPFKMGDKDSLPEEYHQYWPLIEACRYSLAKKGKGEIVFLTIMEGEVKPGNTQRRGGLHIDSPGMLKLGGQYVVQYHGWGRGVCDLQFLEGGIFLASSVSDSCRVWDVCLRQPQEIAGPLGDVEHLRDTLGDGTLLGSGELVWLTDTTPHESLPLAEGGYRQFFRLVTSSVSVWYEKHSTANRLGIQPDPAVTMVIREDKFTSHALSQQSLASEGSNEYEAAWNSQLQEWMIDTGHCTAAAVALKADGRFFAAAPSLAGAGWAIAFSDDHEEEILMADGVTTVKVVIDEASTLQATVKRLRAPPQGLWLGGKKYHVLQAGPVEECDERNYEWILAMSSASQGVHIITAGDFILACFFDKKSMSSGSCKNRALEYAATLLENKS